MASDAIYNCSRGNVTPLKHALLGLTVGTLTGSKSTIEVLNRMGHCIGYKKVKEMEAQLAYNCKRDGKCVPQGLKLEPDLALGLAWDNYDANMDTLDGKDSLHIKVGINYQNRSTVNSTEHISPSATVPSSVIGSTPVEIEKIPEYYGQLKTTKFDLSTTGISQ